GSLDLLDPEDRAGVWMDRLALLRDLGHSISLYVRVRPFDPHALAVAAGPVWAEAEDLAEDLVQRSMLLVVPSSTTRVMERRLRALLGTDAQDGLLALSGLDARVLSRQDKNQLLSEAYGVPFARDGLRKPAIELSPGRFRIETGTDDPPPIGDMAVAASKGMRSYRTLVATGLPDRLAVGWTWPATGGQVLADVAFDL